MSRYFVTVVIEYLDGTTERVQSVTRQHVDGDALHLFCKNGSMADEEHLGSYPLVNIKRWQRT